MIPDLVHTSVLGILEVKPYLGGQINPSLAIDLVTHWTPDLTIDLCYDLNY